MKKLAHVFILCAPLVLYAQGNPEIGKKKAEICAACHGPQGISTLKKWPNLAGQHEKYLVKQLNDLKQGTWRRSAAMTPLMAQFSEQDIDDFAAYYAKMAKAEGSTPEKYLQRGQQLYRGGDFNKHITACIACHGPKGAGNAQAGFPMLSGQHAAYTAMQLKEFKNGKRKNDLNHIMQDICSKMSTDDMNAVAHYIEGLY